MKLVQFLDSKHLIHAKFAERCGIKRSAFCRYVNGSRKPTKEIAEKIVNELVNINQAIVLVNNATETKWFQSLIEKCNSVCFPSSRIKFLDPQGKEGAPLQGQAIIYFGQQKSLFSAEFSKYGAVFYHA